MESCRVIAAVIDGESLPFLFHGIPSSCSGSQGRRGKARAAVRKKVFWAKSQRGQLQFRAHRRPRNRMSSTREGRTRLLAKPSSSAGVLGEPIFPSEDVDTDPLAVCRRPVRSNAAPSRDSAPVVVLTTPPPRTRFHSGSVRGRAPGSRATQTDVSGMRSWAEVRF